MSLALSTAERADILRRHDAAIRGSLKTKLATIGTIVALAGFFVYGLTTLETSLWKIIAGFGNLGTFVMLMLPPDPGSFARAVIFVKALFETIAIAFLGTILAAILALPLGFIAARNVVANILTPRIKLDKPFWWPDEEEEESSETLYKLVRVDLEPADHPPPSEILQAWPDTLDAGLALFRTLDRFLIEALEQASDL